jgi:hypothetical protein
VADKPLDFDALARELEELTLRERDVSARRRKVHERLNAFPNELNQRHERELSDERQAIHRRIDEITAQLRHEG